MPSATIPDIRPLTVGTWDALADLFAEGGDPRWCWCMWWRMRSKDFSAAKVSELREALHDRAVGSQPPGLVAFEGDRAVGWVSLGPRADFARLERSRTIPRIDDQPVWSVVCFAVSPSARGRGIASRLLEAAMTWARERGARSLEAYPVDAGPAGPIQPGAAYTGTLEMFLRSGFQVVSATGSSAGGRPRVVVRAEL